jgi:hypothetical protein
MAAKIKHCPILSKFDMWVDNYDVPNWFRTLKNFYRSPFSKWPPQYRTNQNQLTSPFNFKLIPDGKLKRYQCKRSRQIQGHVFGLWRQYVRREITTSQPLREYAFVYGPTAQ